MTVDNVWLLPDIPMTSSDFWQSEDECTLDLLKHVFRSTTDEEIPLLEERLACLREAGQVLYEVILAHFLCVQNMQPEGIPAYDGMRVLSLFPKASLKSPPVW